MEFLRKMKTPLSTVSKRISYRNKINTSKIHEAFLRISYNHLLEESRYLSIENILLFRSVTDEKPFQTFQYFHRSLTIPSQPVKILKPSLERKKRRDHNDSLQWKMIHYYRFPSNYFFIHREIVYAKN
jgi:hypothetical protein